MERFLHATCRACVGVIALVQNKPLFCFSSGAEVPRARSATPPRRSPTRQIPTPVRASRQAVEHADEREELDDMSDSDLQILFANIAS